MQIKNKILTLRGYRLEKCTQNFADQGIQFDLSDGVVVKSSKIMGIDVLRPGNVGCFLGHFAIVKESAQNGYHVNVFEDDIKIAANYIQKRDDIISQITEPIDYINFCPARISGSNYTKSLLKVSREHYRPKRNRPNVWSSNYLVSPRFCETIVEAVANNIKFRQFCMLRAFDQVLSHMVYMNCHKMNCFTVKCNNRLSTHNFYGHSERI